MPCHFNHFPESCFRKHPFILPFSTPMARLIPFEKLLEREIRKVVEAASSLEPAQRLDALKLGVDWQKAISKREGNAAMGAFFNEEPTDD